MLSLADAVKSLNVGIPEHAGHLGALIARPVRRVVVDVVRVNQRLARGHRRRGELLQVVVGERRREIRIAVVAAVDDAVLRDDGTEHLRGRPRRLDGRGERDVARRDLVERLGAARPAPGLARVRPELRVGACPVVRLVVEREEDGRGPGAVRDLHVVHVLVLVDGARGADRAPGAARGRPARRCRTRCPWSPCSRRTPCCWRPSTRSRGSRRSPRSRSRSPRSTTDCPDRAGSTPTTRCW